MGKEMELGSYMFSYIFVFMEEKENEFFLSC